MEYTLSLSILTPLKYLLWKSQFLNQLGVSKLEINISMIIIRAFGMELLQFNCHLVVIGEINGTSKHKILLQDIIIIFKMLTLSTVIGDYALPGWDPAICALEFLNFRINLGLFLLHAIKNINGIGDPSIFL